MGRALIPVAEDDPLARAIAPPADETPEMRTVRLQAEARAKQVSDAIDSQLLAEKQALKKKQRNVKVLLLGQSESGKSTTLKNFQLSYAPKAWAAEKEAWRIVIQLNLVRSINTIADAVAQELALAKSSPEFPGPESFESAGVGAIDLDLDDLDDGASVLTATTPAPALVPLTEKHAELIEQLKPLRTVQSDLERRLGSGAEEDYGPGGLGLADLRADGTQCTVSNGSRTLNGNGMPNTLRPAVGAPTAGPHLRVRDSQEFFVRSNGWKNALARFRPRMSMSSRNDSGKGVDGDDPTGMIIAEKKGAMRALWGDKAVRDVVKQKQNGLQESGEFFLSEIDRVASVSYTPSDDDIMRARLRTIGVQEHHVTFENGRETGHEWLIYDVGGSRSMRAQWPSYFDDVNAIIFLAPINCFDERLLEDRRVNRLDDSLQLWKFVCSNKLLARTELVLFLNKCDLLDRKLKGGMRFADWVKSYEGKNEAVQVATFLKSKFSDICRQYSKEHRGLHIHFTSVVDTKATAKTLAAVQDGILRTHLRHLDLI